MKYSEADRGRSFVIRLEDGDVIHEEIEKFASEHDVQAAALIVIGGADAGSKLVVGPELGRATPVVPMEHVLDNVCEVEGVGTIFPDESDNPRLHMHISCGRRTSSVTGCVRRGVKAWNVMEIVLFELVNTTGKRISDPDTGFELLSP